MQALAIPCLLLGLFSFASSLVLFYRANKERVEVGTRQQSLARERQELQRGVDALKKETLLSARDEAHVIRQAAEQEARELRAQAQRQEERLAQREESLERRLETLEQREEDIRSHEREIQRLYEDVTQLTVRQREELERLGSLTQDEARAMLLKQL